MASNDAEKIKEKLDIVDVIGSYIKLQKAGKNFKGLCPFHQETDPSFIVSPERQSWHCFGCSEGGDVIKFVMLYENFDFPEALRFLAEKAGIRLQAGSQREQQELNVLYNVNKDAEDFFFRKLIKNKPALTYFRKRSLTNETIKEFKLGFSPGGDELTVHLLDKGYKIDDLVKADLAYKNERNLYRDRFGGRIIFPLKNRLNKVVGFSGRILSQAGSNIPKYVNTAQTRIYNKSKLLYGLNRAKPEIAKSKTAFLVEGYMDVIMAWQSGIKNAVAVAGTSLTTQHLINLQRLADTILISFDNDTGGLRALERAIVLFGKFDFHIKAVDLGKYNDPAEVCETNPEFLKKAIQEAKPALTYLFEAAFKNQDIDIVERKKKIRRMLQNIKEFKSSIDQDIWLKELSKHSGVSEIALWTEFENIEKSKTYEKEPEEAEKLAPEERVDLISCRLLVLVFANNQFFHIVKDNRKLFPKKYQEMIDNPKSEEAVFLEMKSTCEVGSIKKKETEEELRELLRQLEIEYLKNKQIDLKDRARKLNDDDKEKLAVLKEFQDIARQVDKLR